MTAKQLDIAVIGAGVVGMATALRLQAEGHQVRVFDPVPPGESCSFGNAGVIEASSVIPLANPGTIARVPRMLLDRKGPLKIRWRHLPALMPWLLRFLSASRRSNCLAGARALVPLAKRAVEAYRPLLTLAQAEDLFRYSGWSVVYDNEASLEASQWERDFRTEHGIPWELWQGETLRQQLPALGERALAAVHYPSAAWCVQPFELVQRFAGAFRAAGGEVVAQRVNTLSSSGQDVALQLGDGRATRAQRVVVAAGAWSHQLAAQLGDRVPLDTERGYHNMLNTEAVSLPMPMMLDSGKFVITPMKHGIRLAGTAEMGGLHLAPDYGRADVLIERARALLPALPEKAASQWMGFRPTLPDSLPVIGPARHTENVIYAFGHQHLGLTLAGVTASLVAQRLTGDSTEVDLTPYAAQRFT
jgi:D-amino-acid dehydrogenase